MIGVGRFVMSRVTKENRCSSINLRKLRKKWILVIIGNNVHARFEKYTKFNISLSLWYVVQFQEQLPVGI